MLPNALQAKNGTASRVRKGSKRRERSRNRDLECREAFDLVDDVIPWTVSDSETYIELLAREANNVVDTDQWPQLQPQLSPGMRVVLVDWMIEVGSEFMLKRETCHLAVHLVDLFTQLTPHIPKTHYQLLGTASLLISSKLEEVLVPKLCDLSLSTASAFTPTAIRQMEREILTITHWKVLSGSLAHWASWAMTQWDGFNEAIGGPASRAFTCASQGCYALFRQVMQVLDAVLMDYRHLKLRKSELVACVMFLVLSQGEEEPEGFQHVFEYFAGQALQVSLLSAAQSLYYISAFLTLSLDFSPAKVSLSPGSEVTPSIYAELLAIQTHNPHSQAFVKHLLQ